MYFVQFSALRPVEYQDPRAFDQRVRKWLQLREGENTYLLELLARAVETPATGGKNVARMFTVEDENHVVAAGMLVDSGCFCMTWATREIEDVLIQHMLRAGCQVTCVYAPGHVSSQFAEQWAGRTGQVVDYDRSERVYQLSSVNHTPASTGRLELATEAHNQLLLPWLKGFLDEARKETSNDPLPLLLQSLVAKRILHLWCDPEPVAMAAWVQIDGHCSINFVYVPPFQRGKGHAKGVTAALAQKILAAGHRHCFILTDTHDELTNHLYQSIGGYGVADLLRCTLRAKPKPDSKPEIMMMGRLNITNSRFCAS